MFAKMSASQSEFACSWRGGEAKGVEEEEQAREGRGGKGKAILKFPCLISQLWERLRKSGGSFYNGIANGFSL